MHTPSSYWFIAERHTASDEIIRTYDAKELFNQRVDFAIEQKQSQSQVPQQGVVA
ncbi:MAG: sarcosine oxidase subunit D [uncultured bacterium]|nr:MAG: sarcosine oxidase subunit D [uncultured bacterium]